MSIFGRVLSGDIKVCIREIMYTELSSATLGEHEAVRRAKPRRGVD